MNISDFRAGRKVRGSSRGRARAVRRDTSLTLSNQATIYGCCGLFDICGDADLMSLSFESQEPLLDWIGWEPTDQCQIIKNFIAWTRPEMSGGNPTPGYLSGPCEPANGSEWGVCDFTLRDFGALGRKGPVRAVTKYDLKLCDTQPRYRLDGTPILDDREFDMRVATEDLMQDLRRYLVTGNKATPGLFDGLRALVKYGYTNADGAPCGLMDSNVIDWNNNPMSGGGGITWNGQPIAPSFSFIDLLMAAYRRTRQRIRWSPALNSQQMQVGDLVLVLPESFVDCVLNHFTCWQVCEGRQYNEVALQSFEARTFRRSLDGGMFGAGRIFLHGWEVPILPFDWEMIKGPSQFDAYLLLGQVGAVKTLQGQFHDLTTVAQDRGDRYEVTDSGMLLTYHQDDERCEVRTVYMEPRVLSWTPWANTRFIDVNCAVPGGPLSPDPLEGSFFPVTSFNPAVCPV